MYYRVFRETPIYQSIDITFERLRIFANAMNAVLGRLFEHTKIDKFWCFFTRQICDTKQFSGDIRKMTIFG